MKQKLLLLLFSIMITGCTVQYNLNIDNDYITENTTLLINEASLTDEVYNQLTSDKNSVYLGQNKYYTVDYQKDNYGNLKFNYNYKHNISDFMDSKIISWCYTERQIINDAEKIAIKTEGMFNCSNKESNTPVDSADINITTKLKVTENNADEINGNTYTWHVNNTNYTNKPINITMKKQKTAGEVLKNNVDNIPNKEIIVICLVLAVSAVFIYFYLRKKQMQQNKF